MAAFWLLLQLCSSCCFYYLLFGDGPLHSSVHVAFFLFDLWRAVAHDGLMTSLLHNIILSS